MLTFLLLMLFIFWTMFGSFASVIIYRIKSGEGWIATGRSHCKTCERNLSAIELVPIFSWLIQKWKCRGCRKKISSIYPLLELTMWVLFMWVWYFMIDMSSLIAGSNFEIARLFFFLSIIFLTVIYVYYDILYLEIPESILLIVNIWVLIALIFQTWFTQILDTQLVFFPWMEFINGANNIWLQIWVSLFIFWGLYVIMTRWLREIYDLILLLWLWGILLASNYYIFSNSMTLPFESPLMSAMLWAMALFSFFFAQIFVSGGNWMWAWDLRIAILSGMICGIYLTLPAGFITYISGSIIWVWLIMSSRAIHWFKNKMNHQVPFGPFIAAGYIGIMFFHTQISSIIALYF